MGRRSKLEDVICSWYPTKQKVLNNRKIAGVEMDIYFPKDKLAVEVDGVEFHTEFHGRDESYHSNKVLQCNKKNIRLISFYDYDIRDNPKKVKAFIDREMLSCTLLHANMLKPCTSLSEGALENFLEVNHRGFAYCSFKKLFVYADKKGLAMALAVRHEKTVEGDNILVLTDVVFRNGLYVHNWFEVVKTLMSPLKGFYITLPSSHQPILFYALQNGGAVFASCNKPSHYWYKNKQLFHPSQVEDTTGYSRIFDYGFTTFTYGEPCSHTQDELVGLGFPLRVL